MDNLFLLTGMHVCICVLYLHWFQSTYVPVSVCFYAAVWVSKLCQLNLISDSVSLESTMDFLLSCRAAPRHLYLVFFFFCVGKAHRLRAGSKCFSASKSMQVQILNALLSITVLFSSVLCLLVWLSHDLTEVWTPVGVQRNVCVCLFCIY